MQRLLFLENYSVLKICVKESSTWRPRRAIKTGIKPLRDIFKCMVILSTSLIKEIRTLGLGFCSFGLDDSIIILQKSTIQGNSFKKTKKYHTKYNKC